MAEVLGMDIARPDPPARYYSIPAFLPVSGPRIVETPDTLKVFEELLRKFGTVSFDVNWVRTENERDPATGRKTIEHIPAELDPKAPDYDPEADPSNLTMAKMLNSAAMLPPAPELPEGLTEEQAAELLTALIPVETLTLPYPPALPTEAEILTAYRRLGTKTVEALTTAIEDGGKASAEAAAQMNHFTEVCPVSKPYPGLVSPRRRTAESVMQLHYQQRRKKAKAGRRARLHDGGRKH